MIPKLIHWDAQWGRVSGESMSRLLRAEGYAVSEYHYPPGTIFPLHHHAVDKKDTVLRGRLRIAWEGGAALLAPGDMIEIPAGVRHSAEVIGMETVVSLDATKGVE
jgi:quercetin dioxygenase-like cupin family protein